MVVFGVLIIKFLPEKSFLSLEYLTIGEEVVFLLVLSVLVVKVSHDIRKSKTESEKEKGEVEIKLK